jgi:hypothetical protein
MPTYSFRDKDTGVTHDKFLSFSGRDEYLKQNPNLEQVHTSAPAFTGDHISAVKKHDTGFKEVLQRIHEKTPGSQLNKTSSQL